MRILLAEDEKEMSKVVSAVLELKGYEVDAVFNGAQAVEAAASGSYDCVVMDIMMPVMTGIEALRQIRSSGNVVPVILLTAKAEVEDRVEGLDAGADDYLTKPFAMEELLARVRSQTRRRQSYTPSTLQLGGVTLDVGAEELRCSNSIRLPGRETKLMELLMLNHDKPLSTEQIFERVWRDDDEADVDIVWIYVNYLRNKLQSVNADVRIVGEKGESFHAEVI